MGIARTGHIDAVRVEITDNVANDPICIDRCGGGAIDADANITACDRIPLDQVEVGAVVAGGYRAWTDADDNAGIVRGGYCRRDVDRTLPDDI